MRAEIIAVGDELTSGQRLDTNSQFLSQQLADQGVRVLYHSTVGDDLTAEVEVFRRALARADLVVATGGLGPTADDLTRDAIAEACGVDLVLDEASLEHIQRLFASRGRTMPQRNRIQAMFPRGSRPIPNPHGTAPGVRLEWAREGQPPAHLFALPGVPAEMKELWEQSVRPELLALRSEPRVICHRVIKCFGVGESELEQMLPDLIRRGRVPSVGITASRATIALRITAEGADEEACQRLMEPTINTIRSCLGTLVFGEGEGELQHAVVGLLSAQQRTLALADCGTEALVVHWLNAASTESPGCFRGALAMPSAVDWMQLGAPPTLAERHEPVPLVTWLAEDCRRRFAAQLGLAIGPWPSEPGGDILFALATPEGTLWRAASTAGHPELQRARAAKQALNLVRLWLSGAPTGCSGSSACGT